MKRLPLLLILLALFSLLAAAQVPFQITTTELGPAVVGQPYFGTDLFTQGTASTVSWQILPPGTGENPPPGFTVGSLGGNFPTIGVVCFGAVGNPGCADTTTPVNIPPGSYKFTVRASTGAGAPVFDDQQFTLNVYPPVQILTQTLPDAVINQPYSFQFQATGGSGDPANLYWYLNCGGDEQCFPPPGFSFDQNGVLSATSVPQQSDIQLDVAVYDMAAGYAFDERLFTLHVSVKLTISTLGPLFAVRGQPFSQTLASNGGRGPYTWSASQALTQLGLHLNSSTGEITGTPNASGGNFTVSFQVTDAGGQTDSKTIAFSVAEPLVITSSSFTGTVGAPFSKTLTASGGTQPYGWAVFSNEFSGLGLSLDAATGQITGTPNAAGDFPFDFVVSDFRGQNADRVVTLTFSSVAPSPTITSSSFNGMQGVAFSQSLAATGGTEPYTWAVESSSSSAFAALGLLLNSSTGAITGTPNAQGNFQFDFRVTDSNSKTATKTIAFAIAPPGLAITSSSFSGTVGIPLSQVTLMATGGTTPYTWSVVTASQASFAALGFQLDAATGAITGAPQNSGSFPLDFRVTDASSQSVTRTITFSIAPAGTLTITSTSFSGTVGVALSQAALAATGGTTPYTWSVVTTSQAGFATLGLQLNPGTGAITGTPNASGNFQFDFRVTDSTQQSVTKTIAFAIAALPLTITSSSFSGEVGVPLSQAVLTATGGTPLYSWSVDSSSSSAFNASGLQLNASSGAITGTPNASGNLQFDFLVRDSTQQSVTKTITFAIAPPPSITSSSFNGTLGVALSSASLAAAGGTEPYAFSVDSSSSAAFTGLGLQLDASTGAITGMPNALGTAEFSFRVTDANNQTGTKTVTFIIALPPPPDTSVGVGGGTQPPVSLTLGSAFPLAISGVMTLNFTSSVGGTDDMVRFNNGQRTLNFTVPQGQTQATFTGVSTAAVVPGTVAGTITVQVTSLTAGDSSILPSPAPSRTITIDSAVPVINSVTVQQSSATVTVVVTGYSNTREISGGLFHFDVNNNGTQQTADTNVTLTSAFAAWFGNTQSNATGGLFKLTIPFTLSSGVTVNKVTVTVTNTKGNSAAVSSQ
jgi:Putative Ig domain